MHLATAAGVDVGWEKVPEMREMREMRVVPPPFSQDTMPADVGIEGGIAIHRPGGTLSLSTIALMATRAHLDYTLACSDEQFMAVTHIVRSLLTHMSAVYEMVPKPEKRYTMRYPMLNNILHQKLMAALPDRQFSTKEFIEKAQGMGIRSRSQCMHLLGKWCSKGIITRQTQGVYVKK